MLSLTRAAGSRIQCPGVATNVLRRHGTFPSPHDFLHLRAPQFSTTTSRFAYKKRPPTPLQNRIREKQQKLVDMLEVVRKRQRDNGVSEEEINRQDQIATALVAASLAAGVYYLYSAWMGPGNKENDWVITVHEGSAVEVKKPEID